MKPLRSWLDVKRAEEDALRRADAELAKRLAPHMQRELSALRRRGGGPDLPKPCRCDGDCGCPKDAA